MNPLSRQERYPDPYPELKPCGCPVDKPWPCCAFGKWWDDEAESDSGMQKYKK